MAKLPKEYVVCKKKFDLDKKVPKLSVVDFVSLSPEALNACRRVTITYEIRRSQHKRLTKLAKEYNFRLVITPESVGVLTKSMSKHRVIETEADLSIPDAQKLIDELEKPRGVPSRNYVVKIIGNPPPKKEQKRDRMVLTRFGPMRESEFEALTYRPTAPVINGGKFYFTGSGSTKHEPIVQQAYYNRIALAEAMATKLPWQATASERNALKYHICCEMSDEEVVNLAVNAQAQLELVKGYAVKK